MKGKIINLFGNKKFIQNQDVKYSELLEQFITPFASDFERFDSYEDIFEFAVNTWNFGNMKTILPEGESDAAINAVKNVDSVDVNLMKKMIDYKVANFQKYTNFIVDFEIEEKSDGPVLSVTAQEQDVYLASMFEDMEAEYTQDDYDENYINRSAIILKPLQPFLDWCTHLYPKDTDVMDETNTYLVSDDVENVDAWLKNNFDKLFVLELEAWHTNKKEWPQKRSYKMFKQWFQVDISTMVYDLEKEPVSKEE